jgi:hypothetical protein
MLNRKMPPRASQSDDKRIGNYHPIFSPMPFDREFRFPWAAGPEPCAYPLDPLGVDTWAFVALGLGGLGFDDFDLGLVCLSGHVGLDPWAEPPPRAVTPPPCRAAARSPAVGSAGGRPPATPAVPEAEPSPGRNGRRDPAAPAPDPFPPDPFPNDPFPPDPFANDPGVPEPGVPEPGPPALGPPEGERSSAGNGAPPAVHTPTPAAATTPASASATNRPRAPGVRSLAAPCRPGTPPGPRGRVGRPGDWTRRG